MPAIKKLGKISSALLCFWQFPDRPPGLHLPKPADRMSKMVQIRDLSDPVHSTSKQQLAELAALPAERYAQTPLLRRIWELRHNFTPYDAVYIALAEETNSILYTCDAKLSKGHRARVMLFTN